MAQENILENELYFIFEHTFYLGAYLEEMPISSSSQNFVASLNEIFNSSVNPDLFVALTEKFNALEDGYGKQAFRYEVTSVLEYLDESLSLAKLTFANIKKAANTILIFLESLSELLSGISDTWKALLGFVKEYLEFVKEHATK